jgi:ribosomal protein RSM22 (predicted rRNA methylase)
MLTNLPEELAAAIQRETENTDRAELARASEQLTMRYKAGDFSSPVMKSHAQRSAYLVVRAPATFAANANVFAEICRLVPQAQKDVASFLDLGAGPGTALWAAAESFSGLQHATLVECDQAWLNMGRHIAEQSRHVVQREARWVRQDLSAEIDCPVHDLVVISYTLGELPVAAAKALVLRAWNLAARFLVIIEPGTPRGFGVVHSARTALIASAAKVLAPCPHDSECPMAAAGDWCHFAQRIPRTSLHRQLKSAALGYEDEKFSYVAAARDACAAAAARIVRHPQKHSGHVLLTLCTQRGIERQTVTRSQKNDYSSSRRAEWGESWSD